MSTQSEKGSKRAAAATAAPFSIDEQALGESCLQLRGGGELDLATVDRLISALEDALNAPAHVVLDLQPCSFLDSSGIAAILRARRQLADRDCVLCVVGPCDAVERVLDITGLMASDLVKDDLEAALLACGLPATAV